MLKRDQVPRVSLPQEEVHVPSLGGSVIVRGLPLSFVLNSVTDPDFSFEHNLFKILNMSVVLEDGEPVYSENEWDIFSSGRKDEVMLLLGTIKRLSGMDQKAVEKNLDGQP